MAAPQSRTRLACVRMVHTSRISVIRMATNLLGLLGRLPDLELRRTAFLGGPRPLCVVQDDHSARGRRECRKLPAICAWRERMEALPTLKRFRAAQPPRGSIEHARKWVAVRRQNTKR